MQISDEMSLGGIALLRNEGNPNHALAELMAQVIGMMGFIHATGAPMETVMEAFEAMVVTSRTTLEEIMKEDEEKCAQ